MQFVLRCMAKIYLVLINVCGIRSCEVTLSCLFNFFVYIYIDYYYCAYMFDLPFGTFYFPYILFSLFCASRMLMLVHRCDEIIFHFTVSVEL